MEIYEQSEIFIEKNGDYVFDHTKLILKENEQYFHATIKNRLCPSLVIDVNKIQPVPIRDFWPPFDRSLTRVPKPQSNKYFIKRPSLLYYTDEEAQDLSKQILDEANICEIIRKNPHPNIAEYMGCIEENGSIIGLCFVKYTMDLIQRVQTRRPLDTDIYLRGIENGIQHLHRLGVVHNDINPRNIMIDEDDKPIIIDFDSCKLDGEELGKSGTPGWAIENARYAKQENDYYGLSMIKKYLMDNCT
jgi:serine/threonine protein kinase